MYMYVRKKKIDLLCFTDNWLVVGLRPVVRLWDLGLKGGELSVKDFLKVILALNYSIVEEKPRKNPNG